MLTPSDYVGQLVKVKFTYYNNQTKMMDVKARPFLIIKCEKDTFPCDFNGLPVSSISYYQNVNCDFDVQIEAARYPKLNISRDISYIRVHKIQTFHSTEVDRLPIASIRNNYENLYQHIINSKCFARDVSNIIIYFPHPPPIRGGFLALWDY